MTSQQIFEKSARGLLRQKTKSARPVSPRENVDDSNECLYRDPRGRRCALGFLIPDDLYSEEMEGHTLDSDDDGSFLLEAVMEQQGIVDATLLLDLQSVHDDHHPETWRSELLQLAKSYGLRTPKFLTKGEKK